MFAAKAPDSFTTWYNLSRYIVVLSVKDLEELHQLRTTLLSNQVSIFDNYEPDLGNQLTSIAVNPLDYEKAKKLLSNIPLAFQERKEKDEIIVHYNKAHNADTSIPQWVVKHKGNSYYVSHIDFKNVCFSTKETPNNPHTKGSLKFKGKLTITNDIALIE